MSLYINNKQYENKIKKTISSIVATKTIKKLEMSLTEKLQDLSAESYKILCKYLKRSK